MEKETERMVQGDEGLGSSPTGEEVQPTGTAEAIPAEASPVEGAEKPSGPPPGYEQVPPELWPGPDGKPPQLTEKLLKRLRGKYFTVKHPKLVDCGHRLDMINEPNHRNCENCWFQFFNTHPQLVEVSDQFFRTHGKPAMIGMRGEKYVKMFCRYMATIIEFAKKEGRLPNDGNQGQNPAGDSGAQEGSGEAGSSSQASDQVGEAGSGRISSGLVEENVRNDSDSEVG